MFENMSEPQAREAIIEMTREYCNTFHKPNLDFCEGDRVGYAGRVYDENEMVNLIDSSLDFWLTAGRYTEEFEAKLCRYLDVKYSTLVNSGSSANLLAFMALTSPLLHERSIKPGDEVITVAANFPTTLTPMIQYGAIPVFVDITIPQYNIDVEQLETALSSKTKAVMLAHTLGNPFDLDRVRRFCDYNSLWLIEDNCDSLGSKCLVDGEEHFTGTIGDIGTSSFYPPHHITMGEGGAVYTNNPILHQIIRSMRDWGRDCVCPPGKDNACGHRYDGHHGTLPAGYDHKYVYSHFGYNLKATDMQAAIGCAQIDKLSDFTQRRIQNFNRLLDNLSHLHDVLIFPTPIHDSTPSWFGFLITCKVDGDRAKIVNYLESKNIQTRMLFAGNMIHQPCFDHMRSTGTGHRVATALKNTNIVMNNSFWVGVYPGMTNEMIDYVSKMITDAVIK